MSVVTLLPDLSSLYSVNPEQTAAYRKNGHLLLRQVCTAEEIASWAPVLTKTIQRLTGPLSPLEERDTVGKAFSLVGGIWNRDPIFARFTRAPRFARIAADLLSVECVRLYHDVAINKEPGGGYTPWHQDGFYWPMNTPHSVTMWMPLVDVSEEMGALTFASGSHHDGDLGEYAISDNTHEHFEKIVQKRRYPVIRNALRAGDATFHSGWCLHSAPPNKSDQARQVITVVFYADGARTFDDPKNPHRRSDWENYMPGVGPNALAASHLNPRVWPPEKAGSR